MLVGKKDAIYMAHMQIFIAIQLDIGTIPHAKYANLQVMDEIFPLLLITCYYNLKLIQSYSLFCKKIILISTFSLCIG